jgi:hypothetical protein
MSVLTIMPFRLPENYFGPDNVNRVRKGVEKLLEKHFDKKYTIDDDSIYRVLHRTIDARLDTNDLMIDRTIMDIASEIKQFELERKRNLNLEQNFPFTGGIYDVLNKIGPDLYGIKRPKNISTLRFYHTYFMS